MNQNHTIDMRRPFAAEYAEFREDVSFWQRLSFPTQQAIVMYFSDAEASLANIEKECGCSQGAVRRALSTRAIYDVSYQRVRMVGNRHNAYSGPKGSAQAHKASIRDVAPAVVPEAAATGALAGTIRHLDERIQSIENSIRSLVAEKEQLITARKALEAIR